MACGWLALRTGLVTKRTPGHAGDTAATRGFTKTLGKNLAAKSSSPGSISPTDDQRLRSCRALSSRDVELLGDQVAAGGLTQVGKANAESLRREVWSRDLPVLPALIGGLHCWHKCVSPLRGGRTVGLRVEPLSKAHRLAPFGRSSLTAHRAPPRWKARRGPPPAASGLVGSFAGEPGCACIAECQR